MYSWLSIHLKSCLTVPGHAYRYKSWNERSLCHIKRKNDLPHQKEKWTDELTQWYNTLRLREGMKMKFFNEINLWYRQRQPAICQDDRLFLGSQKTKWLLTSLAIQQLVLHLWEITNVDKKIGKCSCWINAQLLEHNWHMRVFFFQDNCNQIVLL